MLYSVIDNRNLHIGEMDHYYGPIKSYNNPITIFFTLAINTKIRVGNRTHYVNKKDYLTHLQSLGISVHHARDLKDFADYKDVADTYTEKTASKPISYMRDHISEKTREKMTKELWKAVFGEKGFRKGVDTERARMAIGCGADVNKTPSCVAHRMLGFIVLWKRARRFFGVKERVTLLQGETPLLRAMRKKQDGLVQLLKEAGASLKGRATKVEIKEGKMRVFQYMIDETGEMNKRDMTKE